MAASVNYNTRSATNADNGLPVLTMGPTTNQFPLLTVNHILSGNPAVFQTCYGKLTAVYPKHEEASCGV